MNLESKWLEDFSALAATRSFSQAAERRFVTQPAFSRRIRSLEAALGLTLVNRSRTPIELTAAGQLFLVTARTVVEQLGEVVRHLHHLESGQGEVMQVAAVDRPTAHRGPEHRHAAGGDQRRRRGARPARRRL